MWWVAADNWPWLLLAAVLGAVVSTVLTLRRTPVVEASPDAPASPAHPDEVCTDEVRAEETRADDTRADGAGADGAGARAADYVVGDDLGRPR